jgi:hypothetical protein
MALSISRVTLYRELQFLKTRQCCKNGVGEDGEKDVGRDYGKDVGGVWNRIHCHEEIDQDWDIASTHDYQDCRHQSYAVPILKAWEFIEENDLRRFQKQQEET